MNAVMVEAQQNYLGSFGIFLGERYPEMHLRLSETLGLAKDTQNPKPTSHFRYNLRYYYLSADLSFQLLSVHPLTV